jgi:DNA-binding MarR family transcriptional regulator
VQPLFGDHAQRVVLGEQLGVGPCVGAELFELWEYVILSRLLGESGLTQKELAHRSRRDPTRLIGHLDALDARHLIAREVDGADRRRRTVRLTEEGRQLVLATRRDIRQMEADLLGGLSADAQNELRDALTAVLRHNS